MTVRGANEDDGAGIAFGGEIWTDARGYATVPLPREAGALHGSARYELRPFTPGVTAVIVSELLDGRFTIATDEPHIKVAWRVTGRNRNQHRSEGRR